MNWDDEDCRGPYRASSGSTFYVIATARPRGLEATGGVQVADRQLTGITCIRLDATVVPAHSDKERAEPNFKGFGHHPIQAG